MKTIQITVHEFVQSDIDNYRALEAEMQSIKLIPGDPDFKTKLDRFAEIMNNMERLRCSIAHATISMVERAA